MIDPKIPKPHISSPLDFMDSLHTFALVKGPTECLYKRTFQIKHVSNLEVSQDTILNIRQKDGNLCCCPSTDWIMTKPNSSEILITYRSPGCCSSNWEIYPGASKHRPMGEVKSYGCCNLGLEGTFESKEYKIRKRCTSFHILSRCFNYAATGLDYAWPGVGNAINEGVKVCCYVIKCWRRMSTHVTNIPVNGDKVDYTMLYKAEKCCLCCESPPFFINNLPKGNTLNEKLALIGLELYLFTDLGKMDKEQFGKHVSLSKVRDIGEKDNSK